MAVVIDEMEATIDPEASQSTPQEGGAQAIPKEQNLDKIRSELSRLAQREMRLRAD